MVVSHATKIDLIRLDMQNQKKVVQPMHMAINCCYTNVNAMLKLKWIVPMHMAINCYYTDVNASVKRKKGVETKIDRSWQDLNLRGETPMDF